MVCISIFFLSWFLCISCILVTGNGTHPELATELKDDSGLQIVEVITEEAGADAEDGIVEAPAQIDPEAHKAKNVEVEASLAEAAEDVSAADEDDTEMNKDLTDEGSIEADLSQSNSTMEVIEVTTTVSATETADDSEDDTEVILEGGVTREPEIEANRSQTDRDPEVNVRPSTEADIEKEAVTEVDAEVTGNGTKEGAKEAVLSQSNSSTEIIEIKTAGNATEAAIISENEDESEFDTEVMVDGAVTKDGSKEEVLKSDPTAEDIEVLTAGPSTGAAAISENEAATEVAAVVTRNETASGAEADGDDTVGEPDINHTNEDEVKVLGNGFVYAGASL